MPTIAAEICCDIDQFLLKDQDGLIIDFPELLTRLTLDHKDHLLINNPTHVSMASVGTIQKDKITGAGNGFFAFAPLFWKKLGKGRFKSRVVYAQTLGLGVSCLGQIHAGQDEDLIWNRLFYSNRIEQALRFELFQDANTFLTEALENITFTSLDAQIKGPKLNRAIEQNNYVDNFQLVSALLYIIRIHFDFKYQTPISRDKLVPYFTLDLDI